MGVREDYEDMHSDFKYHFSFNRMLPSHAKAVAGFAFCQDGGWLVSADALGDMRVWDARSWAEVAKLKGQAKDRLIGFAVSPGPRWLVGVQSTALTVYRCGAKWPIETAVPAMANPETGDLSRWLCVAFSPAAVELDHQCGVVGSENLLVAISPTHITVMDYSGGWSEDMPKRTHSLLRYSQVTCVAFMSCGGWILTGHECGSIHVWNSYSLTADRKLVAHKGHVVCLTASPKAAMHMYEPRFVSCGSDRSVCVWRGSTWVLEQSIHGGDGSVAEPSPGREVVVRERPAGGAGEEAMFSMEFSSSGLWFLSTVTKQDLCVWRVDATGGACDQLSLRLHERLKPVGSAEGVRAAGFCGDSDAIVLGACDGILNIWVKRDGLPERLPEMQVSTATARGRARSAEDPSKERLPRPLMRVQPQDLGAGRKMQLIKPSQVDTGIALVRPTELPLPQLRTGGDNSHASTMHASTSAAVASTAQVRSHVNWEHPCSNWEHPHADGTRSVESSANVEYDHSSACVRRSWATERSAGSAEPVRRGPHNRQSSSSPFQTSRSSPALLPNMWTQLARRSSSSTLSRSGAAGDLQPQAQLTQHAHNAQQLQGSPESGRSHASSAATVASRGAQHVITGSLPSSSSTSALPSSRERERDHRRSPTTGELPPRTKDSTVEARRPQRPVPGLCHQCGRVCRCQGPAMSAPLQPDRGLRGGPALSAPLAPKKCGSAAASVASAPPGNVSVPRSAALGEDRGLRRRTTFEEVSLATQARTQDLPTLHPFAPVAQAATDPHHIGTSGCASTVASRISPAPARSRRDRLTSLA